MLQKTCNWQWIQLCSSSLHAHAEKSLLHKKCPKCMASLFLDYVNNVMGPMIMWKHYLMKTENEEGINIKV
jgi:hypothetical protein